MRRLPISIAICLAAAATSARAEDMPMRKPGLWEIKMAFDGRQMPAQTMQQCIDAKTDEAMRQPPGSEDATRQCSAPAINRSGGTMTIDTNCTIAGKTSKTHTVITGSFDSSYNMKMSFESDGASNGMSMTMDARWLGACKADQRPGDMIMPGGMKINIDDMKNMRRGGAPGGAPQR
jgi:hypothetical protein